MKTIFILTCFLCFSTFVFSQEINQDDQTASKVKIITDEDNEIENIVIENNSSNGDIILKDAQTLLIINGNDTVIINDEFMKMLKEERIQIDSNTDKYNSSVIVNKIGKDTTNLRIGNKQIIILEEKEMKDSEDWGDWSASDFEFDKYKFYEKKSGSRKKRIRFEGHFQSVDIGLGTFTTRDHGFSMPDTAKLLTLDEARSYEISLNLLQVGLPLYRQNLGIVTGLGITWNSYRFDNSNTRLDNSQNTIQYFEDTTRNWKKSKLSTFKVTVPVLFEARQHSGFWFQAGVYGSVKLGSKNKMKATNRYKMVERESFHINPFQYGVMARMGYENFGIYSMYNLSSLFKKDEGTEIYTLSIGLTFTFN